ncbi:MAG: GTP 3',8-cyclase MoaA [Nitrospirota bacterium]|nr:GTP 3',8-cyclase MoaA [Nitrospirota bacterium]MDH4359900.1 GTP 3',8-cyclase MoaA [Nitrospirota bacterium]MDH5295813.1 GTP 3',8-cyclase MoaA [Nitrospirota bacterium]MDH5575131.1 GTP 3',8-cyclase MoaA [Nitrospirota bacterium]
MDSGEAVTLPHMVKDSWGRPLRSLRISVTDRCNLRCQYCMPEENYVWLPRENLLTFEEIALLTNMFSDQGIDRVRITGGEPLLRNNVAELIRMLRQNPCIQDIAMTTNGVLLSEQAQALFDAGLHRVTVSLDTLKPERFKSLTRRDTLDQVFEGIASVGRVGFSGLKLDTVTMKGYNEDELIPLLEYGKQVKGEVRFIEYMDVGGANDWSADKVLSRKEILKVVSEYYGTVEHVEEVSSAPAQRFRLPDGTTFGIISSTTMPFCSTCDRSRLTADGMWYLCLYAKSGLDLRKPLRMGRSREDIRSIIQSVWETRKDRGAEERKELEQVSGRGRYIDIDRLRKDPHLEMHARGG